MLFQVYGSLSLEIILKLKILIHFLKKLYIWNLDSVYYNGFLLFKKILKIRCSDIFLKSFFCMKLDLGLKLQVKPVPSLRFGFLNHLSSLIPNLQAGPKRVFLQKGSHVENGIPFFIANYL